MNTHEPKELFLIEQANGEKLMTFSPNIPDNEHQTVTGYVRKDILRADQRMAVLVIVIQSIGIAVMGWALILEKLS